jgi:hypothetical protein
MYPKGGLSSDGKNPPDSPFGAGIAVLNVLPSWVFAGEGSA